ncbi:MAG: hypothetical protein KC503_04410 [Myxococcales bacterium]|nr:hypothetical protein [Myxococcales bacterium]
MKVTQSKAVKQRVVDIGAPLKQQKVLADAKSKRRASVADAALFDRSVKCRPLALLPVAA